MTPARSGALVGALLGAVLFGFFLPVVSLLHTYIAADLAYRLRSLGDWASTLVAILGYLILFLVGVSVTAATGAFVGIL